MSTAKHGTVSRTVTILRWLSLGQLVLTVPLILYTGFLWAASSLSGLWGGEVGPDYGLYALALGLALLGFVVAWVTWIVDAAGRRRGHGPLGPVAFLIATITITATWTLTVGIVVPTMMLLS